MNSRFSSKMTKFLSQNRALENIVEKRCLMIYGVSLPNIERLESFVLILNFSIKSVTNRSCFRTPEIRKVVCSNIHNKFDHAHTLYTHIKVLGNKFKHKVLVTLYIKSDIEYLHAFIAFVGGILGNEFKRFGYI